MIQRVKTAAVIIGFAIIVAVLGHSVQVTGLILVSILAAWEYFSLIYSGSVFDQIWHCIGVALLSMAAATMPELVLPLFILNVVLLTVKDICMNRSDANLTIYSVWGTVYTGLFFAAGIVLFESSVFLWIAAVATACVTDTMALFGGMIFGKHKLAPAISPNKTWEGALSGFICGLIPFTIAAIALAQPRYYAYGAIAAFAGQFGDLSASMVKRQFGIKDFSNALPGHGGFLDRIDSILYSMATVYALEYIFAAYPFIR